MDTVFCQGLYGSLLNELVEDPGGALCAPSTELTYKPTQSTSPSSSCQSTPEKRQPNDNLWSLMDDEIDQNAELSKHFEILSRQNDDTTLQVMTQDIMEELQSHLPLSKRGESFWLQYSLVRDGASLEVMMEKVAGESYSVLALETTDGQVFGAFLGQPLAFSKGQFRGSGETFLWRVPELRSSSFGSNSKDSNSIVDDSSASSLTSCDLDVYKFAFSNQDVQLVSHDRLVIGGGCHSSSRNPHWGFGLVLEKDLLKGSSSPCLTFASPPLTQQAGSFEVRNLEVWALTPSLSLEDAEKSQRQRRLLRSGGFLKRAFSSLRKRSFQNNRR